MARPRLRTVEKYSPPYPLNQFPPEFAGRLGEELAYVLTTRSRSDEEGKVICDLEGKDWEQIFAASIGASWRPSNVGLDDIILEQTAWGAKSVKGRRFVGARIPLISGRNSPAYSYGDEISSKAEPAALGKKILEIYNERVAGVKSKYRHLRTVVLVKSNDLTEVAVFELDTEQYDPLRYEWHWNERNNLRGVDNHTGAHKFTWQPSGSQFTIVEQVPPNALLIQIECRRRLQKDAVLKQIGFERSWVKVSHVPASTSLRRRTKEEAACGISNS